MSERVCAVVVTFNRKTLLLECIAGLLAQTRPLDRIIIVDNASSDGTADAVEAAYPAASHPQLAVERLNQNTGGAGGFSRGVQLAHQQGFDWIWIMDDDVEPLPGGLEGLLAHRHLSEFLHGVRIGPDGPYRWETLWDLSRPGAIVFKTDISFANGQKWIAARMANFEGALFTRRIVDCIGLPDTRFFVAGDDLTYGFLASFHTQVVYVNIPVLKKKLLPNPATRFQRWYFWGRNRFLVYEYMLKAQVPLLRPIFWLRIAFELADEILNIFQGPQTWKGYRMFVRGLRDGMAGRFGPPPWVRDRK